MRCNVRAANVSNGLIDTVVLVHVLAPLTLAAVVPFNFHIFHSRFAFSPLGGAAASRGRCKLSRKQLDLFMTLFLHCSASLARVFSARRKSMAKKWPLITFNLIAFSHFGRPCGRQRKRHFVRLEMGVKEK